MKFAIFCLVMNLISALFLSFLPFEIGRALDSIFNTEDESTEKAFETLFYTVLKLGFITIGFSSTTFIRMSCMSLLQEKLAMDMKMDIFATFVKNDMHFFENYKSGEIVSRLGTDIPAAKSAISNNLTFFIRSIATAVFNMIFLFLMSWKLALVMISILPFYSIFTLYFNKKNKILIQNYQDHLAEMSAFVSERMTGIQVIKSFPS